MSTRADAWSRHYQEPWKEDAANPRYPLALRVAFLAFGSHRANGHARFKQGEVAKVLARVDESGDLVTPDRRTVYRAIQQAVDFGLLAEGSKALCLIVPSHRISGGLGDEDARCDRHREQSKSRRLRAVS